MTENEAIEKIKYRMHTAEHVTGEGGMEDLEMAVNALEEIQRWHTSVVNPNVKNEFANRSTQICHNCDHKDEYIEELKAELRRREGSVLGMPKAVLIMDMPEQVCQKCTLCYETENDDEYLCCATGKLVPDGAKPDWCPLRELPEKIPELKSGYEEISKSIHRDGWNACLDEILGGKDDGTTV